MRMHSICRSTMALLCVFFFKQKTAYEMRISDWSSDVCSSDLEARTRQNFALALALSGRWAQARIVASQDLSLDKLEGRMAEWSKLAEQPNAQVRVASLIGTEAQQDAGMPVRLALSNFADTRIDRKSTRLNSSQ